MARGDGKSTGRKVKGKGEVKGEARAEAKRGGRQNASPGVAAEAALSFLKETKGVVIWGVKELGETLKIGRGEAEAVAVAFGDFLRSERARVQAADVGIRLVRRGAEEGEMRSAADAKAERAFLRVLRGRAAMVQLRDCAEWMGRRAYRKLL